MAMTEKTWEQKLDEARIKAEAFDRCDEEHGYAKPQDVGIHELVTTAMAAIQAGINQKDWSCVIDAYVLLEKIDLEKIKIPC